MHYHHLQHLARTTGALLSCSQVIVSGMAAVMKSIASPSIVLRDRFEQFSLAEFLIYDNDDAPRSIQLIEHAIGDTSPFLAYYGYGAKPLAPWEVTLPEGWRDRLVYMNSSLKFCPHILALSPVDVLLTHLMQDKERLLAYELLQNDIVSIDTLTRVASNWDLSSADRWRIQTGIAQMINLMNGAGVEDSPGALFDRQDPLLSNVISMRDAKLRHR